MVRANESELTVPLRKAWSITRYKRAPRAIQIIREHVIHHLKVRKMIKRTADMERNPHAAFLGHLRVPVPPLSLYA